MKSLLLSIMLLLGVAVMAQTNFSGTWELARSKSTLGEQFSMAPVKLVLTQEANSLKMERTSEFQGNSFTQESSYTLDGKESVNDGWQDMKVKSTATWGEGKKVLTIASVMPMQGEEMKTDLIISMDGASLKIVSKSSSSFGDMEETWIFDKK